MISELEDLTLEDSQKQKLYESFDAQTIQDAIAYTQSLKKIPDNLGAYIYRACQRKYKNPEESEPKKASKPEQMSPEQEAYEGAKSYLESISSAFHLEIDSEYIYIYLDTEMHSIEIKSKNFTDKLNKLIEKLLKEFYKKTNQPKET